MFRRWLLGILIVVAVAIAGLFVIAWRPSIAPIDPPAAGSLPPERVARGAVLAGAGYCATCHTARGGARYAGGYPMATAFGTIHSTNITPDPDTGIGRWSEAAFVRAMRSGVARDGSHLFPAFPFDHFTKVTDQDLGDLYAFLMSQPPVAAPPRQNTVPFPLNLRALQAGWKLLFLRKGVFEPDPARSEAWNRGAYLAEGLSHCGACHTPRNVVGAERRSAAYAGARVDGWEAPPLTAANPAPVPWSEDALYAYLRSGVSALHGSAAGSMSEVVHDGLSRLPDADIRALAVYFADVSGAAARADRSDAAVAAALAASGQAPSSASDAGAELYRAACASCHYNRAPAPLAARPELALVSALGSDDPTNLIRVVLEGIGVEAGMPGVLMPPFAHLGDADLAALAAYLRRTRTTRPPWPDLEAKIAEVRRHTAGT